MAKGLLLVYSNCAEGQEEAFNRWYDTVHLPDILAVDGIVGAQRFKLSGPGPQTVTRDGQTIVANYLAVYELDTDDTRAVMKRLGERSRELAEGGRMFAGLQVVASGTYVALGERQGAVAPA